MNVLTEEQLSEVNGGVVPALVTYLVVRGAIRVIVKSATVAAAGAATKAAIDNVTD